MTELNRLWWFWPTVALAAGLVTVAMIPKRAPDSASPPAVAIADLARECATLVAPGWITATHWLAEFDPDENPCVDIRADKIIALQPGAEGCMIATVGESEHVYEECGVVRRRVDAALNGVSHD